MVWMWCVVWWCVCSCLVGGGVQWLSTFHSHPACGCVCVRGFSHLLLCVTIAASATVI